MKYVPPYGISDPDGPYVNGDPSIGRQGSIPPAAAFEHPMREIVGVINKSHFTPDSVDLLQLTKAVRSQYLNYVLDQGTADTLTVACDPPLAAYTPGLPLRVRVKFSNTGASTIDAGAGRVQIRRPNGNATALGDLTAGGLVDLVYDGAAFQMINFLGTGGAGGTINNYNVNLPYTTDTSVTPNIITANFSPAITTLSAGMIILVKIANTNTAATTINVNAISPKAVKAQGSGDLLPYDIVAGAIFAFIYDGTSFYLDPNTTIDGAVTVNVPTTQFNTPAIVFEAMRRKNIGASGSIKIKLATGIFAPFVMYHANLERFTVEGTMLAAPPTFSNFNQSGPSGDQRNADGAANLIMLRSRYGTEIQCAAGTTGQWCISVASGNAATVKDLLLTSANTFQNNGVGHHDVVCINVAAWGLNTGFYGDSGGTVICSGCWASNCFYGFDAQHGSVIGSTGGGGAFGCSNSGMISIAGSHINCANFYSRCNGLYGCAASHMSDLALLGFDSTNNGAQDVYAENMSLIKIQGNATTFAPSVSVFGNNGSLILTGF